MSNNETLVGLGIASLVIILGGIRAYSITQNLKRKSARHVIHESWVSRKTNKSHNPRKSKTQKYLDSS